MERLEQADAAVAEQEALIARTNAEGSDLSAEAKRIVAEATAAFDAAHPRPRRDRRRPSRPTSSRSTTGSPCAARARRCCCRRTCEGCRMVLAGTDLQVLRQAAEDQVVTCPECGCILVRGEDSGL